MAGRNYVLIELESFLLEVQVIEYCKNSCKQPQWSSVLFSAPPAVQNQQKTYKVLCQKAALTADHIDYRALFWNNDLWLLLRRPITYVHSPLGLMDSLKKSAVTPCVLA